MALNGKLTVACVQFRVTGDVEKNYRAMVRWMRRAADLGAELVQFSETALTGYYRVHVTNLRRIDRELLARRNADLCSLAVRLGLWLVYGSTHFPAGAGRPYNCLYLVDPQGRQIGRYDKIFLTDTDAVAYQPGNRLVTARIKDFVVGLTICFDMRFPELFRKLMYQEVNLILISSYQAGGERADHMRTVAPATLITRASENGIYLSASNTSEAPSWHESLIVSFNGRVLARAQRHRPSLALATLDLSERESFTDFIRQNAAESMMDRHPLLGRPLASDPAE